MYADIDIHNIGRAFVGERDLSPVAPCVWIWAERVKAEQREKALLGCHVSASPLFRPSLILRVTFCGLVGRTRYGTESFFPTTPIYSEILV